jgi:hypothetical protein
MFSPSISNEHDIKNEACFLPYAEKKEDFEALLPWNAKSFMQKLSPAS